MIEVQRRAVPPNIEAIEKLLARQSLRQTSKTLNRFQREALYQLIQTPAFSVLLDIMEENCIQQETALVNVPAGDEKEVLAQHKLSKAMWLFFLRLQKRVEYEVNELFGGHEIDEYLEREMEQGQ